MSEVYEFDKQEAKGWEAEQHFYTHLLSNNQNPVFNNPEGNNKEYDIEANKIKYEVKIDFYDNDLIPIEYVHIKSYDKVSMGWLSLTKSDYIIFYKKRLNKRFWIKTKDLQLFINDNISELNIKKPTKNANFQTINFYLTIEELTNNKIIKRAEDF